MKIMAYPIFWHYPTWLDISAPRTHTGGMACWARRVYRSGVMEFHIHHGPRDALDKLPMYILAAEKDAHGPSKLIKRRLGFYSLSWFKSGDCWYWSKAHRRAVRLEAGQVIAVCPGVLHAYGARHGKFQEDYVAFFGPVADGFLALGLLDPARPLMTLREPERSRRDRGDSQGGFRGGATPGRVAVTAHSHRRQV